MPKARLIFDGDGVYTEKEARIHKLTQETENKIDNIPGIVDDVNSTSTTDALSANMGKYLQDQINNISGTTIFLSTWDCTTGLPETDPVVDPYTYKTGNYYIVGKVASSGGTNYRPHGASYTHGVPSTSVETQGININDWYIYDGQAWVIQPASTVAIVIDDMLKPDSRNAVENRAIYSAVSQKQDRILDLGAIRDGASAGATSIQPGDNITELINNAGYQTAGDVAVAIQGALDEFAPEGVGTGILTLQKNSVTLDTFSANALQNKTINIAINKTDVGLSNVDNTADLNKPMSTATKTYVDNAIEESKYVGPSAPENPEEGMLWYDTTNDVLKSCDGANWNEVGSDAADINTKTFYLSNTSDLTTAQAAYDWYLAGKNPIIVYNNKAHIIKYVDIEKLQFGPIAFHFNLISNSTNSVTQDIININFSAGVVTSISISNFGLTGNFLRTDYNYYSPYTPAYDGSPATKKYVDDKMFSGSTSPSNPSAGQLRYDTTNNILMVYDGSNWVEVSSSAISDTAFSSSWDGDTTHAPSKNAIYDVLGDVETLLANL